MDEELMEIVEKVDTPYPLLMDILSIALMIGGAVLLAVTLLWDPIQGRPFSVGDKQRTYIMYSIAVIVAGYITGLVPDAIIKFRERKKRRSRR